VADRKRQRKVEELKISELTEIRREMYDLLLHWCSPGTLEKAKRPASDPKVRDGASCTQRE